MFSVDNINNLQYIYLECAERVGDVQDVDKDQLKRKYSAYYHSSFAYIQDFLDTSRWIHNGRLRPGLSLSQSVFDLILRVIAVGVPIIGVIDSLHNLAEAAHFAETLGHLGIEMGHFTHRERVQRAVQGIRGDELTRFIKTIAANLTYRFRQELSLLSINDCAALAIFHSEQVKKGLEECAKDSDEEFTSETLIESLLNYIDPEPKNEIENRIKDYIEKRDGRLFRSQNYNREEFLIDFNCSLKNNETPLTTLILQLSSRVFFKDKNEEYTLNQEFPMLSPRNPFITNGNYRSRTPIPLFAEFAIARKTFNNPSVTAVTHKALCQVSKDIMMLLIRLQITQLTTDPSVDKWNKKSRKMINIIASPELTVHLTFNAYQRAKAEREAADVASMAAHEDKEDAADELAAAEAAVRAASRRLRALSRRARPFATQAARERLTAAKANRAEAYQEAMIDAAIATEAAAIAAAKAEDEREEMAEWEAAQVVVGILE